jgi:hypothetical protein
VTFEEEKWEVVFIGMRLGELKGGGFRSTIDRSEI